MGRFYLHDQVGIVTRLMKAIGLIASDGAPLGSATGAWIWITVIDSWQWIPFTALLFWISFRLIPNRQKESAKLDNLNYFSRARFIYIPHISTPITIIILFRVLEAFRAFDLPNVLTGGGPGISTLTTSLYANRITFFHHRYGLGSAHLIVLEVIAYLLIVVIAGKLTSIRTILKKNNRNG